MLVYWLFTIRLSLLPLCVLEKNRHPTIFIFFQNLLLTKAHLVTISNTNLANVSEKKAFNPNSFMVQILKWNLSTTVLICPFLLLFLIFFDYDNDALKLRVVKCRGKMIYDHFITRWQRSIWISLFQDARY